MSQMSGYAVALAHMQIFSTHGGVKHIVTGSISTPYFGIKRLVEPKIRKKVRAKKVQIYSTRIMHEMHS